MRVLAALALAGLAACATREQIAEAGRALCLSQGYQEGTPAYAACREAVAAQRAADRRALAEDAQEDLQDTIGDLNRSIVRPPR